MKFSVIFRHISEPAFEIKVWSLIESHGKLLGDGCSRSMWPIVPYVIWQVAERYVEGEDCAIEDKSFVVWFYILFSFAFANDWCAGS